MAGRLRNQLASVEALLTSIESLIGSVHDSAPGDTFSTENLLKHEYGEITDPKVAAWNVVLGGLSDCEEALNDLDDILRDRLHRSERRKALRYNASGGPDNA